MYLSLIDEVWDTKTNSWVPVTHAHIDPTAKVRHPTLWGRAPSDMGRGSYFTEFCHALPKRPSWGIWVCLRGKDKGQLAPRDKRANNERSLGWRRWWNVYFSPTYANKSNLRLSVWYSDHHPPRQPTPTNTILTTLR